MQSTSLECKPIGYFHCSKKERYHLPKQPGLIEKNAGFIRLISHLNFEQALEDLKDFSRIWVIFWFHRNTHWKPKVLTPHGYPKRSLFSTRSPHRPNPIGLSCLEVFQVKGLVIEVGNHDLIDGTPILDIKPYLEYADAWSNIRQGWIDKCEKKSTPEVFWTSEAMIQLNFIKSSGYEILQEEINFRLMSDPFPTKNNRIRAIDQNIFQLAYKSWRVIFSKVDSKIEVIQIKSGYDKETLLGCKTSLWNDLDIHRAFNLQFYET